MRVFSERAHGIPPEQVIGSTLATRYEVVDGNKGSKWAAEDRVRGRPRRASPSASTNWSIGRRPILAVGNSDGDLQMLEYTTGASGPRLGLIVHHDDTAHAYDQSRRWTPDQPSISLLSAAGWS